MDHCHNYVSTMTDQTTYKDPNTGEEFGVVVDDFHHIILGMFTIVSWYHMVIHETVCFQEIS